jgi:spore germination protein
MTRHRSPASALARLGVAASLLLAAIGGTGVAATAGAPAGSEATAVKPLGGTELYGYLPYWQMSTGMADYLAGVPVSTLELFSMTAASNGGLLRNEIGYRRIAGQIGARIIREAHARDQRVELVFTSFGYAKNDHLFGRPVVPDTSEPGVARWDRTATELVAMARRLGLDGINVDVELIDGDAFEGYTSFLAALRSRLDAAIPHGRLSVATMASNAGADLARAAIAARVDRVFLMGYEYHWSGSEPGGSSPIDRLEGRSSLRTSIAAYLADGVPPGRMVLGLPLYGMSWPVASPDRYADRTGKGTAWIPSRHAALLGAAGFQPNLDLLEVTEYTASPGADGTWQAIYYDSPRTLRPKLLLARTSGFAGAGFWAIGYERGLPGYLELMRDFRAGAIVPAPPADLGGP